MESQLQALEAKAYKLICTLNAIQRELNKTEQEILKLRKDLEPEKVTE
jgi:hypothetical protein